LKFHHIGILVRDLEQGKASLGILIPNMFWEKVIEDIGIGVKVLFGEDATGVRYELVAPINNQSLISNYLNTKDNMLHHLAYTVDNFDEKYIELRSLRLMPLSAPMPATAFGGKKVAFFLTPLKTILEIIEE
jgi:methylmalonyl-CoA/ethylmalonyl-CoA epimerase